VTKKSGIVIDLVEYRDLDHVGVRFYENDLGAVPVENRLRAFEHGNLIVNILRSHGISASLEKIAGNPPNKSSAGPR
jgi:hypothetical protein